MGDNIRDAALRDMPAPEARKGWVALSEQARVQGFLAAESGATCMRLTGSRLLIDRTASFSEDEFHRVHREYQKYGINDLWVIGPKSGASAQFLQRNKDAILVMLHSDRKDSRFLIDGVRYSLAGGLKYVMTGEKDASMSVLSGAKVKLSTERLHRSRYRKLTLRPETAGV